MFNEKTIYQFFKDVSLINLEKYMHELYESYGQLYDMASDYNNREAVFLKELCDVLIQINAVTCVYARDKKIHPNYVLEKLNHTKRLIETNIKFWESKKEE